MELPKMSPVSATEPPMQAQGSSGMAIASLVLGLTSIVPLIGVLLGILAIILGVLGIGETGPGKKSGRGLAVAGIILGIFGIALTFVLYGALFYFGFKAEGGPFAEAKIEMTRQMLTQTAGALELYRKANGEYPRSLDALRERRTGGPVGIDFYQRRLVYRLSEDGKNYTLYSLGPDGKDGTEDDIHLPEQPASEERSK